MFNLINNPLNNPWFIGVVGGVFSGVIVTFISRSLLSRRDRKEYLQKILSSNNEVIYALRPGISEGLIPDANVIEALITATSRKYGVDRKDLYNCSEIGQELIKEVMDSSFIAMNTKTDYCNKLAGIVYPEEGKMALIDKMTFAKTASLMEYREKMVTIMSTMMGIIASIMGLFIVFFKREPEPFGIISEIKTSSAYFIFIIIIFTILTIFLLLFTQMKRYLIIKKKKDEEKEI